MIVNPRARYQYRLLEKYQAGVVLTGPEVKSVRAGHLSLKESHVRFKNGEAWWVNAHINPYPFAFQENYDPKRSRKLLLKKEELERLAQKTKEKGLTVVPVACYNKKRKVKLEIALAKGKRRYEKREAKKRKDIAREIARQVKV